jgi:hypothetical protein
MGGLVGAEALRPEPRGLLSRRMGFRVLGLPLERDRPLPGPSHAVDPGRSLDVRSPHRARDAGPGRGLPGALHASRQRWGIPGLPDPRAPGRAGRQPASREAFERSRSGEPADLAAHRPGGPHRAGHLLSPLSAHQRPPRGPALLGLRSPRRGRPRQLRDALPVRSRRPPSSLSALRVRARGALPGNREPAPDRRRADAGPTPFPVVEEPGGPRRPGVAGGGPRRHVRRPALGRPRQLRERRLRRRREVAGRLWDTAVLRPDGNGPGGHRAAAPAGHRHLRGRCLAAGPRRLGGGDDPVVPSDLLPRGLVAPPRHAGAARSDAGLRSRPLSTRVPRRRRLGPPRRARPPPPGLARAPPGAPRRLAGRVAAAPARMAAHARGFRVPRLHALDCRALGGPGLPRAAPWQATPLGGRGHVLADRALAAARQRLQRGPAAIIQRGGEFLPAVPRSRRLGAALRAGSIPRRPSPAHAGMAARPGGSRAGVQVLALVR